MHENIVRQIAGDCLKQDTPLAEAIRQDIQVQQLKGQIAAQKKKVQNEKQLNKQVVQNAELKRLEKLLEEITREEYKQT